MTLVNIPYVPGDYIKAGDFMRKHGKNGKDSFNFVVTETMTETEVDLNGVSKRIWQWSGKLDNGSIEHFCVKEWECDQTFSFRVKIND